MVCDGVIMVNSQDFTATSVYDPFLPVLVTTYSFNPTEEITQATLHAPMPVVVVDGNHEVWPCLSEFLGRYGSKGGPAVASGRFVVVGRPRQRLDLEWSALRRARRQRIPGPVDAPCGALPLGTGDNHPTVPPAVVGQRFGRGPDVLVCHDAPEGTTGLVSGLPWDMPADLRHDADTVQALLRSAVDATEPAVVFHGHWHKQNRCRLNGRSEVVGLAADGNPPERSRAVDQRPANPIRGPVPTLAPALSKPPKRPQRS